jgi:hypothetical protein
VLLAGEEREVVALALGGDHAHRDEVVAETRLLPGLEDVVLDRRVSTRRMLRIERRTYREALVRLLHLSKLRVGPDVGLSPVVLDEVLELRKLVALGDRDAVSVQPGLELAGIPRLVD